MNWKLYATYWLAGLAIGIECLFLIKLLFYPGVSGSYSEITRTYWCNSPAVCTHEQGHALDHALGWPSRSPEYRAALLDFSTTAHPWAAPLRAELAAEHSLTETYTEMYEAAGGDIALIPTVLQKFYQ